MNRRRLPVVGLLAAALVTLTAADALAERIRCSSEDYRYAFCSTRGRVVSARLVKRHSKRPCNQFRTWGWQADGIWVDDGCDADFDVVLRPQGPGGPGGPGYGPGPGGPGYGPGRPPYGPPSGSSPSPWVIGDWKGQGYRLTVSRGGSIVLWRGNQYERGYMRGEDITLYDGTRIRADRDRNRLRLEWLSGGRRLILSRD